MKTLHLTIIAILICSTLLYLKPIQAYATNDVEIQNIQVQPTTILVGDNFTVTATLVNNSPNPIFVGHGACESPFSVTFDTHVLVSTNNINCTLQIIEQKLNPSEKITAASPYIDLVYNATGVGNTNATITFRYGVWNQTSQSNIEKTVSKSFQFMIFDHNIGIPSLNYAEHPVMIQTDSPLKQFKSGIKAENVKCNYGFELVIKAEDGSPACVKPDHIALLYLRGWINHPANGTIVFVIKPNTIGQIFVKYTNPTPDIDAELNTGLYSGSSGREIHATNLQVSVNLDTVQHGKTLIATYNVVAQNTTGIYWLQVDSCQFIPIAVASNSSQISNSDLQFVMSGWRCPVPFLQYHVVNVSNMTVEYRQD